MPTSHIAQHDRFPVSTYRLQFNRDLTLERGAAVVEYLYRLGIDAVYASPLLTARPESEHGYDVTDHSAINAEIGGPAGLDRLAGALRSRGMGLVVDVVPNHMCISDPSNWWWQDVLENGPSSPYSRYFDIEWQPVKNFLANKVLLPFLGDQYGKALENKEIQLEYAGGAFVARYFGLRVPIAPRTSAMILELALDHVKSARRPATSALAALRDLIEALQRLPLRTETDVERVKERQVMKEKLKSRLSALMSTDAAVRHAVSGAVTLLNGRRGAPESFDRLEALLADQAYRLAFWRVAADEINYRRFFDINDLAAIRVEDPEVFRAVHRIVLDLVSRRYVTGLRIDHVDGLYDPKKYLDDLQRACQEATGTKLPFYVVVEKILGPDERLRRDWPAAGTTGYEFLNRLNGVFVDPAGKGSFLRLYRRFTGQKGPFFEILCTAKEMITHVSNASELYVLATHIERISEQHRWSRDFTFEGLRYALREIIACFSVYRSYIREESGNVSPEDRQVIEAAVRAAVNRNPATNASIFGFIGDVLLGRDPDGITAAQKKDRRAFIMRFQQLTGPIMAKGMEDTSFYRYYPLASLNEVGGHPEWFGATVASFHRFNRERRATHPSGLSATTTHDTKRSEDVRARINVLSEVPAMWYRAIRRWQSWNEPYATEVDGRRCPHPNVEYLLYQTIVGTWPLASLKRRDRAAYEERIQAYMLKAMREAKTRTSWVNPNADYEAGVRAFISKVLAGHSKNRFLRDVAAAVHPVALAGVNNALAQTLLKVALPGVPDFFQGTEVWQFTLVDPDNRRSVDYLKLKHLLRTIDRLDARSRAAAAGRFYGKPEDGRIKMLVTAAALRFRRRNRALFETGDYIPLPVRGPKKRHVIAFARSDGKKTAVIVTGRLFLGVSDRDGRFTPASFGDTSVLIRDRLIGGTLKDVVTGRTVRVEKTRAGAALRVASALSRLPIALLESP